MRCAGVPAPCAFHAAGGHSRHGGVVVSHLRRGARRRVLGEIRLAAVAAAVSRPLLPRPRLLGRGPRRASGCAAPRAEFRAGEEGLLPPPEVKTWSRKALRRLQREGPQEADLRDEVGRIVKECLPPPTDARAPNWRALGTLSFSDFMASVRDGTAAYVQVWSDRDPTVYWPPPPIHQPFAGKRALVTFADGRQAYVELSLPEMERVAISTLLASEGALPYSFHQPPGREGYTQLDLGLIAIGGGIFIFLSIYLGIVRKGGIPTDTIQAMEFGQSKAKSRKEGTTGVTFADVAGLGTVLEELQEVVAFLKDPGRFNTVGARPPRGLLLEGGPGTGKTLVAKAVAGEAGVPFYSMAGSEFVEVIVGVGAARVRDLFKRARVNAPCIIFVDEIDALGGRRAPSSMRGNEEREQTLNQLLTEMDGFTPDTGVIFVGATNRADLLDPALLRPGRFDRRVTVRKPDARARAQALRIHVARKKVPLDPGVDLDGIASQLVDFSGAEVANLVNEAALAAVRRKAASVGAADFAAAQDRMQLGVATAAASVASGDALRVAVHEAGHALVACLLRRAALAAGSPGALAPIDRVSVQPFGTEWSRTIWRGDDASATAVPTRKDVLSRVRVLLAGRCAEAAQGGSLQGGPASSLGEADLQDASTLARRAVGDYAMAGGPGAPGLTSFVWRTSFSGNLASRLAPGEAGSSDSRRSSGLSPSAAQLAAAERVVQQLLADAEAANHQLLASRAAALSALAGALLERGVVTGEEVEAVVDAHPPAPGTEANGLGPQAVATLQPLVGGTRPLLSPSSV